MGEIVLGPWRRNTNSPSIIFPSSINKKEHLNSLIYTPPGGKPNIYILYIHAIVNPDYSILELFLRLYPLSLVFLYATIIKLRLVPNAKPFRLVVVGMSLPP